MEDSGSPTDDAMSRYQAITTESKPLGAREGALSALAKLFQNCSEVCNRLASGEITPALEFYMLGMAHAHWVDSARVREMMDPSVVSGPPDNFRGFIDAYEAVLSLVRTTAFASNGNVEGIPQSLQERIAKL